MVRRADKKITGQSFLEAAIVFVLGLLLFGGIYKMWVWGNNNILRRSVMYSGSRTLAGSKPKLFGNETEASYKLRWPIYNDPEVTTYKAPPPSLNETDVLLWNAGGGKKNEE